MRALIITIGAALVISGTPMHATARTVDAGDLLRAIPVMAESNQGSYDRSKFRHWVDADRDGCDTREEVLIAESAVPVRRGPGCRIIKGKWVSPYDGATWTKPSDVDIDHVVALAEAWRSGASKWSSARRQRYANDLGYSGTLIAVTDNVNQSKGDRDPAAWLPKKSRCTYAINWLKVKYRWRLTVNPSEKRALARIVTGSCAARDVRLPKRA